MSQPLKPKPVKLIVGLFMKDQRLLKPVAEALCGQFGPLDVVGPWFAFDFTDYYTAEMGQPLFRRVLAFKNLIGQDDLAAIKIATNQIERRYVIQGKRRVNIDPGYLSHERLVLATAKNYAHRIYIGEGIYADLTLIYADGAFRPLAWTYPDYRESKMSALLNRIRSRYSADLKQRFELSENRAGPNGNKG